MALLGQDEGTQHTSLLTCTYCTYVAVGSCLTLAATPHREQSCPEYHQSQGICIEPTGGDGRGRGERRVVRFGVGSGGEERSG